jgi:hypothetical protein
MTKFLSALIAVPFVLFALAAPAMADPAAEKIIDDAMPLMYHSCKSVVEEGNSDVDYIEKVVRALVAVSLYNHEIDISKYAKTDADKTALRDKFVEALGKECKRDSDALLAGAIDDAVVTALSLK